MSKLIKRDSIQRPLIWTTKEGERIAITAMQTSHLFNAMKMVFNHVAEAWGGEPVWFNHTYSNIMDYAHIAPTEMARVVVLMIAELDRRTDLPLKYYEPYLLIKEQIFGRQVALDTRAPVAAITGSTAPF